MEEKYYIRRFTKVISEGAANRYYWFDIEKYIKLFSKLDFDYETLKTRFQLEENDENKKLPSKKTIDRIMGFFNGVKEGEKKKGKSYLKDKSITIETAKALGKALCEGDEYGLLIKIEPANVVAVMKQAEEMWGTSDINYIYRLMNNLLYELEISSYYSYEPGTMKEGFNYYDMRLQIIRNEIDSRFWDKKEKRDKLYRLVEEEEILIKSYNQPGAPERWVKANPKLRYFDCVFDFIEECPQLYKTIKKGGLTTAWGQVISFNFYPTEQECKDRQAYFYKLNKKSIEQNNKYSIDRLYQNELVDAFRLVFEADFSKWKGYNEKFL